MYDHLSDSQIARKRNPFKDNIISKIIKSGFNLRNGFIVKIKDGLCEFDAHAIEIKLIKLIGRRDLNLGPLSNLTDGGEGSSGYKHTAAARLKMVIWQSGKTLSPQAKLNISKGLMGNKHTLGFSPSLETRLKISQSNKGKIVPKEVREKISEAHKGRVFTDDHKRNISVSRTGTTSSPETRLKISMSLIGNKYRLGSPHTQESKDKISRFNKGKILSDEHRIKISQSNKGKVKNLIFDESQVIEIRKLFSGGMFKTEIAKLFNTGRVTIFNILTGKTYKNMGVV